MRAAAFQGVRVIDGQAVLDPTVLEARLRKLKSSCACGVAAIAGLLSLGYYIRYYAIDPAMAHAWRHTIPVGFAWFFCGAIGGKALGLLAFRLEYRRLRRQYELLTSTGSASR